MSDDWPPVKQDNGRNWSKAKLTILKLLWSGEWVEGAKVYEVTKHTCRSKKKRQQHEKARLLLYED
ncbi:hypothetical protein [Desulfonema magnum]|uniref:Uncharacterized protein n=1 Tax=Desulfonema magnum TaxID=45655 RepID=A0A975GKW1_9BACT|nr:hypothetical protein [Desulfonema magnum]QTA84975.1 Uncharacterized protein dnm_009790 [Desulfonema magnum]